jgi:hypothetical protein
MCLRSRIPHIYGETESDSKQGVLAALVLLILMIVRFRVLLIRTRLIYDQPHMLLIHPVPHLCAAGVAALRFPFF